MQDTGAIASSSSSKSFIKPPGSENQIEQSSSVMSDFRSFTRRHDVFEADGVSSVREATPISSDVYGAEPVQKALRFDETDRLL